MPYAQASASRFAPATRRPPPHYMLALRRRSEERCPIRALRQRVGYGWDQSTNRRAGAAYRACQKRSRAVQQIQAGDWILAARPHHHLAAVGECSVTAAISSSAIGISNRARRV